MYVSKYLCCTFPVIISPDSCLPISVPSMMGLAGLDEFAWPWFSLPCSSDLVESSVTPKPSEDEAGGWRRRMGMAGGRPDLVGRGDVWPDLPSLASSL